MRALIRRCRRHGRAWCCVGCRAITARRRRCCCLRGTCDVVQVALSKLIQVLSLRRFLEALRRERHYRYARNHRRPAVVSGAGLQQAGLPMRPRLREGVRAVHRCRRNGVYATRQPRHTATRTRTGQRVRAQRTRRRRGLRPGCAALCDFASQHPWDNLLFAAHDAPAQRVVDYALEPHFLRRRSTRHLACRPLPFDHGACVCTSSLAAVWKRQKS